MEAPINAVVELTAHAINPDRRDRKTTIQHEFDELLVGPWEDYAEQLFTRTCCSLQGRLVVTAMFGARSATVEYRQVTPSEPIQLCVRRSRRMKWMRVSDVGECYFPSQDDAITDLAQQLQLLTALVVPRIPDWAVSPAIGPNPVVLETAVLPPKLPGALKRLSPIQKPLLPHRKNMSLKGTKVPFLIRISPQQAVSKRTYSIVFDDGTTVEVPCDD